jgi:hypothetical protein
MLHEWYTWHTLQDLTDDQTRLQRLEEKLIRMIEYGTD